VGSTASTTEVEEDVDGGPPGGTTGGPAASTTDIEEDIDGGPRARVSIPSCVQTYIGSCKAKHVK
jgi:hypothetical protein